jgi:hypothetical protein
MGEFMKKDRGNFSFASALCGDFNMWGGFLIKEADSVAF